VLGWFGQLIEPIGLPLGLDWKMLVALLASIFAKENSVATLGVLYNVGEQGLLDVLPTAINHASAFSFLVVLMLLIPCLPTITVMKQEMGGWKWLIASLFFMLIASYGCGMLAYRIALMVNI
jgi:ferrous iron transport protein B